ncbi:hypothetical protein Tsac_2832 [Thermoanaerobacterium phage THSA-485A]|uniref:hypothetical protein n=1 Tax=Thermoanaerobacterium phage THSA-485A TaxID=1126885 RepID=UPI000263F829|nr:hypothetical protein Tsac_2832 [Thermoanaerobacterium phage THSA-485A]AFK87685.1 hypothetical protein Tsac_2832 [Thermoanaerobacterium phage THSA-485A]
MKLYFIQKYVTKEKVLKCKNAVETLNGILKDITIVKVEDMLIVIDGHHRLFAYSLKNNISLNKIKEKIIKRHRMAHVIEIENVPDDVILYDSILLTESEEIFAKSFPFENYIFVTHIGEYLTKPLNIGDRIVITGIYKYSYTDPYMGHIYWQNFREGFLQDHYDDFFEPAKVEEEKGRCDTEYADKMKGFIYSYKPLQKHTGNMYWFVNYCED